MSDPNGTTKRVPGRLVSRNAKSARTRRMEASHQVCVRLPGAVLATENDLAPPFRGPLQPLDLESCVPIRGGRPGRLTSTTRICILRD